jgi:hypothetical protein
MKPKSKYVIKTDPAHKIDHADIIQDDSIYKLSVHLRTLLTLNGIKLNKYKK